MGIFDKNRSIPRSQLEKTIRKDSGVIPRTGGRKYYESERRKMTGRMFGSKYGSEISRGDFRQAMRDLELAKKTAKSPTERTDIDRQIKFWKDRAGKGF